MKSASDQGANVGGDTAGERAKLWKFVCKKVAEVVGDDDTAKAATAAAMLAVEKFEVEGPETVKCEDCNGTGIAVHWRYGEMSYVGPGPLPENSSGDYIEMKCEECNGRGHVAVCAECGCNYVCHKCNGLTS